MFKKLKDKLTEEVKSSPQRIQQFAQAAQAAVNSASSSITDITNNDLFSIGESDTKLSTSSPRLEAQQSIPLQAPLVNDNVEAMNAVSEDNMRQRRLSNSSFASDISFRLPSYESPAMYHLQSDMDVSASEAEERSVSNASLEHVTKEQLYTAYRRTQERYGKYRSRYTDLARHYKILERENAKARSVLVETQDKALRRISELREQCSLEQSAKAHLESALRVELDEKNMKIESLSTKIKLLQDNGSDDSVNKISNEPNKDFNKEETPADNVPQLIDFSMDGNKSENMAPNEITVLNNKIEKMELLLSKYKESVKNLKERNSQLTTELQILNNNFESKVKDNNELKSAADKLIQAQQEMQHLKEANEDLQNTINAYEFNKVKEIASLQSDLKQAQEEVAQLNSRIDVFNKREEDYAISLAENKLSIHKELESKEREIKSLEASLTSKSNELQSYYIMVQDFKKNMSTLEAEKVKLTAEISELHSVKNKYLEMENEIKELNIKCESLEASCSKKNEEIKCMELQTKQETAEKLAMIDRNNYLENRNKQVTEENTEKSALIAKLEKDMQDHLSDNLLDKNTKLLDAVKMWKDKYRTLELEINDERVELRKLQAEIEKLLQNYELIKSENCELHTAVTELKNESIKLQHFKLENRRILETVTQFRNDLKELRNNCTTLSDETNQLCNEITSRSVHKIGEVFNEVIVRNKVKHEEVTELRNCVENLNTECNNLEKTLLEIKDKYENVVKENKDLHAEKQALIISMNESVRTNSKEIEEQNKVLSDEKIVLTSKLDALMLDYEDIKNKHCNLDNVHNNLTIEYDLLLQKVDQLTKEKDSLYEVISTNELKCQEYENSVKSLNKQVQERESLQKQLNEVSHNVSAIEDEYSELQKVHNTLKDDHTILFEKCEQLKIDKETLHEKCLLSEQKCLEYETSLEQSRKESDNNECLRKLLQKSTKDLEAVSSNLNDIQKSYNVLKDESILLFDKCEQLKQEKETLYEKLLKSDKKCLENENKIRLLGENIPNNDMSQLEVELLQQVKDKYIELEKVNNDIKGHISNEDSIETEFEEKRIASNLALREIENDTLSAEKSRLLSEIEGLQTHLHKVCRDNTLLNDQLREAMASSDFNYKTQNFDELDKAMNALQEEKQKVNDLLRENTLLAEKNLELEDCINSHYKYDASTQNTEQSKLQDKFETLVQVKQNLERKVLELEQLERSGDCNVQQLQEKNDKLKLSNEKLERRLDEALVSLRHFQALEESTELEYLRNILYEYLTGPGLHSETLAKVIAAVVKFDPSQTKIVLQKEKERQGLLRQLGLL